MKKNKKNIGTGVSIFLLIVFIAGIQVTTALMGFNRIEDLMSNGDLKYAYHQIYGMDKEKIIDELDIVDEFDEIENVEESEEKTNVDAELNVTDSVAASAVVTDVTVVVEKMMPSVVSITNAYMESYIDPFDGEVYSAESEATGSGIIFGQNDQEVLIVTNNHVIDGNDKLFVQFIDGEVLEAHVKGIDSTIDLAVIAIQLTDIKEASMNEIAMARFGDSDSLKVGEPAIAIGNALGYGQSVTTGVISALDRTVGDESTGIFEDLIQTDAAINPGNSGGALLNIRGEVIGINSNKIGGTAIEGMGYAIPISKATPIIDELIKKDTRIKIIEAEQGYIGIQGADVSYEASEYYGIPMGIYISAVYEGTGADIAGLAEGDIIIAMNQEKLNTMEELQYELQYYAKGDIISLTIQKNTEEGYKEEIVEVELVNIDKLSN